MPSIGSLSATSDETSTCRWSTPSAPGFSVSPQSLCRGNLARSNIRTRIPAFARMIAASAPAGPAPAIATSSIACASARPRTSALFFDPKPRQLQSAATGCASRPTLGMKSRSQSGSGLVWLIVGGRKPFDERQRARHHAGGAAGALRMTDHRLGRGPRNLFRQLAKRQARAPRFDGVVQQRRGAVIVDVADLFRGAAGFRHRLVHAAHDLFAVRIHLHAVVGVAGRRVAFDRWRRCARLARGRALRAPAPASTRLRQARSHRGPDRTAARLPRRDRCNGSRPRASARSRRSCPATRSHRCRPTAARRTHPAAAASTRSRAHRSSSCSRSTARG